MTIHEIAIYALLFTTFYFVIGKSFNRVDKLLEEKLNSTTYTVILTIIFVLAVALAVWRVTNTL